MKKIILIVLLILIVFVGGIAIGNRILPPPQNVIEREQERLAEKQQKVITDIAASVLPAKGFKTKIVLGDSIVKLVEAGAIDVVKFETLYSERGGFTPEQRKFLTEPSNEPLTINADNSQFLLNLLWPLGIANKNSALTELQQTELENPQDLFGLAATGGWTLGKAENGGEYYNKSEIVKLTPEQDQLVKLVASNIYRPCCGNSTAFPDCNHGAAMLGLIQLGAAQGLTEQELYKEAVKFNAFWFPEQYTKMALAFKTFENKDWDSLDPKTLLSNDYSSNKGFYTNISQPLSKLPAFAPKKQQGGGGGGGCGV